MYDGLDLPDAAYGDEPPSREGAIRRSPVRWCWVLTGCILLVGMILGALAL